MLTDPKTDPVRGENKAYFEVPLTLLASGIPCGCPLYIRMVRNGRMVLRHEAGVAITDSELRSHQESGIAAFWAPSKFYSHWEEYLAKYRASLSLPQKPPRPRHSLSEVLSDEQLDEPTRAATLSEMAMDVLKDLAQSDDHSVEETRKAIHRCKDFTDAIIRMALHKYQLRAVYSELLLLTRMHNDHSIQVPSLSVIFGLVSHFTHPKELGELALGAMIHDIGMIRLSGDLAVTPEKMLTPGERGRYKRHVELGLSLVKQSGVQVGENVLAIIAQHHEHDDGSGYPQRLSGNQIHPMAQIVSFADQLSSFLNGDYDGTSYRIGQAFDRIVELNGPREECRRYNPALFERLTRLIAEARHSDRHDL